MSSNEEDLYKILGVNENSSDDEIKKAYKKLAIRWHPDKNSDNRVEAEKKFKEISHAFSVLKDKQLKHDYDNMRKGGFSTGGSGQHYNQNFSGFDFNSHDMGFEFYEKMFRDIFNKNFCDFSAFNDDDGFFSSNFQSSGGIGSTTTNTTTTIINGKKTSKTEKTFIDKNGKKVTEIIESDGNGITTKKMITDDFHNNNFNTGVNININTNTHHLSNLHGQEQEHVNDKNHLKEHVHVSNHGQVHGYVMDHGKVIGNNNDYGKVSEHSNHGKVQEHKLDHGNLHGNFINNGQVNEHNNDHGQVHGSNTNHEQTHHLNHGINLNNNHFGFNDIGCNKKEHGVFNKNDNTGQSNKKK